MTSAISNLKYNSSSLSFSWTCKLDYKNTTSSFEFDKFGNKCYFILDFEYDSNYKNYDMQATLLFTAKNPIKYNQIIDCIVHIGIVNAKYDVCLKKKNNKTFANPVKVFLKDFQLTTCKQTSVNIELHFQRNDHFLLENMHFLLSSGSFSDLKLTVENKVFNVHKSILGTRNNVLAKMIKSSQTETINLSKWNVIAVEELLKYIYTGDCDESKSPQELFKVSHFLDIEELQDRCKNYLKLHMNKKNLISILKLTAQSEYNLSELKEATKIFIAKHESAIVKNSDFIDYLSNSICLSNIEFALKFSKQHDIEKLLEAAMKFVYHNYEEVLKDRECEKFLSSNPTLLFKILKYHKNDIAIIDKIETLQQ